MRAHETKLTHFTVLLREDQRASLEALRNRLQAEAPARRVSVGDVIREFVDSGLRAMKQ